MVAKKEFLAVLCVVFVAGLQVEAGFSRDCSGPGAIGEFGGFAIESCKTISSGVCEVDYNTELNVTLYYNTGSGYKNASLSVETEYEGGVEKLANIVIGGQDDASTSRGISHMNEKVSAHIKATGHSGEMSLKLTDYDGTVVVCGAFGIKINSPNTLKRMIVDSSN